MLRLTADPATGEVPVNIRQKELLFARDIPKADQAPFSKTGRVANTYESVGPTNVGGRTRAAKLDIRDASTLIAGGVSGGVWKSDNGGASWRRTSGSEVRNSVTCLEQDIRAGKRDTWYFGSGEFLGNSVNLPGSPYLGQGIYKSTNGGESWSILPSTSDGHQPDDFVSPFQYIYDIYIDPKNMAQDVLLVAAYGGILRSNNGGLTWQTVLGADLLGSKSSPSQSVPMVTSLHRNVNGFYAFLSFFNSDGPTQGVAKLYYSEDGLDWVDISPGNILDPAWRTIMASTQDGSTIYFYVDLDSDPMLLRLDIGATPSTGSWFDLSGNLPRPFGEVGGVTTQGGYNMALAVHPSEEQVVYLGGTNLYRSTDGFTTSSNVKWIGGYKPGEDVSIYPNHYPDQHVLILDPNNPMQLISGNDGGLFLNRNNMADSVEWLSLNNGYVTTQFYTIAQRQDEATTEILGGLQDNGTQFLPGSGTGAWQRMIGGDGGFVQFAENADYLYVSFQNAQIYRIRYNDDFSLSSFARLDPLDGGSYLFVNPYIIDPSNSSTMYLASSGTIFRNLNVLQIPAGSQKGTDIGWEELKRSSSNGIYSCLEKARDRDILYAGYSGDQPGIRRIDSASYPGLERYSVLTSPSFPDIGWMQCVAVNPEDYRHLVVIFSNYNVASIFETKDAGSSFTDISYNLEQFPDGTGDGPSVRWAEIVPTTTGYECYVGTSIGLYKLNEENPTFWVQESSEHIGQSVVTMMDYRPIDGRLVVATHGNGVFVSNVPNYKQIPTKQVSPPMDIAAYPVPFKDRTVITYTLSERTLVNVQVLDAAGKLIRPLLKGYQYAGINKVEWNGRNLAGVAMKQGVYYVQVVYGDQQQAIRVVYLP